MKKLLALLTLCAGGASAASLTPAQTATLDRISANSLRGHLSFLASDLLEGRGTPSRGQDLAAEYIAAQYRRAGLEPLGDDEYFQTANWTHTKPDLTGFAFALHSGATRLVLTPAQVSFTPAAMLDARGVGLVKANWNELAPLEALGAAVSGKIVLVEPTPMHPRSQAEYDQMSAARNAVLARIGRLKPLMVLALERERKEGNGGGRGAVSDPATPAKQDLPLLTMHGAQAIALFGALPDGVTKATLDLHLAAATVSQIKLRNVAALLRGSDPVLKDSYVMLSSHYDHLGMRSDMAGDNIYNGANDDGSGTVSVIEVASALAAMKERPKRSIVFLNVFGEELGMLGSAYYGRHPLVPVARTVADLNLEQVGRTDGKQGPMLAKAALTGYDFSNLPATLVKAGQLTGVEIFKDAESSDQYFAQSDNVALAALGVPAHTLSVLYEFSDYHQPGDHWQKIDYANMARIDRTVALGVLMLANDTAAPRWNAAHPGAAPYLKAYQALKLAKTTEAVPGQRQQAITDMEPEVGVQLAAVLDQLARGKLPADLSERGAAQYTPERLATLTASMAKLGTRRAVELLERKVDGEVRIYQYRLVYQNGTVLLEAAFGKSGKIDRLRLQ